MNEKYFDEAAYDSFVTDIENQNIKDETNRIKNFCSITTSLKSEIFRLELSKCISEDMDVFREFEDCIFKRN